MTPVVPPRFRDRLRRVVADTRPLAVPAFRRTFLGQSTAVIGMTVTAVAVPVQLYALTRSSLVVGLGGLVGFVPIVVFGLYGGAVADAVDRRKLYLLTSLVTWVVTLALLAQSVLEVRSAGADPRAGRRAVGRVRRLRVRPQRDGAAAGARRVHPRGQRPELHGRQRRSGGGAARRGCPHRTAGRLRLGLRRRRRAVRGGAVRGDPVAVLPVGGPGRASRPAVGARRPAVPRREPGPADVVRRRHRRDGAGDAGGAVPAGRRHPVPRRRGPAVLGDRRRLDPGRLAERVDRPGAAGKASR